MELGMRSPLNQPMWSKQAIVLAESMQNYGVHYAATAFASCSSCAGRKPGVVQIRVTLEAGLTRPRRMVPP